MIWLISYIIGIAYAYYIIDNFADDINPYNFSRRNNKVNIDFLKEQVSKLQVDVEKLIRNGNGAH